MKFNKHRHKSKLIIIENSSLLVLKKKNKKRYVFVGGFLKRGESPEEGLIREVHEETDVNLAKGSFKYFATNTIIDNDKNALSRHYFTIVNNGQKFKNKEPDKFKSLRWVNWTEAIQFINKYDRNTIERLYNNTK